MPRTSHTTGLSDRPCPIVPASQTYSCRNILAGESSRGGGNEPPLAPVRWTEQQPVDRYPEEGNVMALNVIANATS